MLPEAVHFHICTETPSCTQDTPQSSTDCNTADEDGLQRTACHNACTHEFRTCGPTYCTVSCEYDRLCRKSTRTQRPFLRCLSLLTRDTHTWRAWNLLHLSSRHTSTELQVAEKALQAPSHIDPMGTSHSLRKLGCLLAFLFPEQPDLQARKRTQGTA